MTAPRGLHALARLHGVQTAYHDSDGRRTAASPESLLAALRALRVPVRDAGDVPRLLEDRRRELWERAVEPVVTVWLPESDAVEDAGAGAGFTLRLPARLRDAAVRVAVALEDGGERTAAPAPDGLETVDTREVAGKTYLARRVPLPPVPAGYHDLRVEVGTGLSRRRFRALLIAAPERAAGWEVLPGSPDWGVFAPLYALWTEEGEAAPHYGLLARLADRVARRGGTVVGTLPLLPAFLDEPYDPSPYAPVSRRFWNELYVRPVAGEAGPRAGAAARRGRPAVNGGGGPGGAPGEPDRLFDPGVAMAGKRRALEAEARAFFGAGSEPGPDRLPEAVSGPPDRPELAAFRGRNPLAWDYARFRALTETHGPWRRWPDRLRARDVRPGDYDPAVARYHLYAQWRAEQQLAEAEERVASSGASLYLDLPLGVHPAGYDVWRDRSQFALAARAGAPPDPLAPGGQDWGFHPPHPEASRREGHRYFIESVRHHLRFAGVLRVDHVMQLHRLFWVVGDDARDGVYVRYPHEELYAVLSLESHRAGSVVVGEDLGTVPRQVRRDMRRRNLPGMYVLEFELRDTTAGRAPALEPRPVPAGTLASIGTHDTPTFAAWWTGRDLEIRGELGLLDDDAVREQVAGRAALREKLARGLGVAPGPDRAARIQEALLRRLGGSRAGLVLAALEDLWLETEPQNVPGTTSDAHWRRRTRRPLGSLADPAVAALLDALNEARKGTHD